MIKKFCIFSIFFVLSWIMLSCSMGAAVQDEPVPDEPVLIGKSDSEDDSKVITKEAVPAEKAKKEEIDNTPKIAESEESTEVRSSVPEEAKDTKWEADTSTASTSMSDKSRPSASGLKAGYADDNKQFGYFTKFLETYSDQVDHIELDVNERIILKVQDKNGKSLPNASVTINDGQYVLCSGVTYADGSFYFFPSEYDSLKQKFQVSVDFNQETRRVVLDRFGKREVEVYFNLSRPEKNRIPLDILFILDTTGSMGEEIERLKTTIEIINLNLTSLSVKPKVRFGMVLYKDDGDEYVTRIVPLTGNLNDFQRALGEVYAMGGGDTPEDLQSALEGAMTKIDWNRDGLRLSFVITDAPPHLDYEQEYTYVRAAYDARAKGIKIYTVGTGGLDLMGEYILRQLSQYTGARYIFLTYREQGESEGAKPGSVSHHTGANYQTDKLEAIIIRFAKEELAFLTDQPLEVEEDYFEAHKISDEKKEETLKKLFQMSTTQLIEYSSYRLNSGTLAAILPISPSVPDLALNSEYFTEQLIFTVASDEILQETFRMVERKDIQQVLEEMELQLSGLIDDSKAVKAGVLLGAEVLITGKLYQKKYKYELFMKMLRVETGEILSITKAVIDLNLGL